MRQLRFSLGVLGMLWACPVGAALADAPATAPPPKAADADSGKDAKAKPAKHKPADAHAKHAAADAGVETPHVKHPAGASDEHAKYMTGESGGDAKHRHEPLQPMAATTAPAALAPKPAPVAAPPVAAAPKPSGPTCSLEEAEQPRGGRLDVLGDDFGQAPVVRIATRPARMLERRADRISVQVPADSNGGAVTLQSEGHSAACGTLVIIGKNR